MHAPRLMGNMYFNFKSVFSIVLMGLVDSDYKFLWIDVRSCGHMSDARLFNASEQKECLEDNSIGFPLADQLPNDDRPTSYYILRDDAFGLRTYLMKPYAQRQLTKEQRVLKYRLSRGRRMVAQRWQILLTTMQHDTSASWRSVGRSSSLRCNTTLRHPGAALADPPHYDATRHFGILAQRWQILLTRCNTTLIAIIVEACVNLHNLMRMRYPALQNAAMDADNTNHQIIPGSWRASANMYDVDNIRGSNRESTAAKKQREYLKLYFNCAAGSVPWQDSMI